MSFQVINDLEEFLKNRFSDIQIEADWRIIPEICPPEKAGDITVNCFRFTKLFRQKPDDLADLVCDFLKNHQDVTEMERIKAFVNISLTIEAIHRASVANIAGVLNSVTIDDSEKQRILIEFSAPNTNKPQHLGHVRNNTLGMALASLLKKLGHDVVPVNLVNDRGIHICKSMIAYQRFGNDSSPESTGKKGDHLVGDYYVKYDSEFKKQLTELKKQNPNLDKKTDEELFLQTEIGAATHKMLQDWEDDNQKVRHLWKTMNGWVFDGFNQTYKRMGIEFNHTYLESETYLLGKDIIAKGLEAGVFKKRQDGAVIVDLGKKMGEKVVLRSDGTSVYITQDIGTTLKKHDDFQTDRQIWIVGDEQIYHFQVLFAIMTKLGYDWAKGLYHLPYGMVNLPDGRMKSREGTVVDADNLFDELFTMTKNDTLERYKNNIPEDLDQRSEIIAMGAIKFMLLKFNPKSSITYDPEASIKPEGDTGPYVQYACARINSIQRKAALEGINIEALNPDWTLLNTQHEKNVSIQAYLYPKIMRAAAEKLDCSIVTNYLLDLAKEFNRFYRNCPVLKADTEQLRNARLAMCLAVRDILTDGLKALTIDLPTAM